MKKFRAGSIAVEIDDQSRFATIHRYGNHNRIIESLSVALIDLTDLAKVTADARAACARKPDIIDAIKAGERA